MGDLGTNQVLGGYLKHTQFYVCSHCHNLITAMSPTNITCCGKKLKPTIPQIVIKDQDLMIKEIENDFYITSHHPMNRDHYISFVALLTEDTLIIKKTYPEWELQIRIPIHAHGRLIWYCNQHGLFYQDI